MSAEQVAQVVNEHVGGRATKYVGVQSAERMDVTVGTVVQAFLQPKYGWTLRLTGAQLFHSPGHGLQINGGTYVDLGLPQATAELQRQADGSVVVDWLAPGFGGGSPYPVRLVLERA